jgi:hypothetical protein
MAEIIANKIIHEKDLDNELDKIFKNVKVGIHYHMTYRKHPWEWFPEQLEMLVKMVVEDMFRIIDRTGVNEIIDFKYKGLVNRMEEK